MPSQDGTFIFVERLGLTFIAQAAGLSALSIIGLILVFLYKAYPNIGARSPGHVDLYFGSLLFGDTIQALGSLMNVKWVDDSRVTEGDYCTAQGAIKQVGDVAVALSSLAIAIDTFAVLFYRWRRPESRILPVTVIILIWSFIVLDVSIGYSTHTHYYGNTGYWCWITAAYAAERIGLEYFWMWACAFILILLYIPLFFALRGNLVVEDWFKFKWVSLKDSDKWSFKDAGSNGTAKKMLWYPFIYIITVLPIAVTRWLTFSDTNLVVPFGATAFSAIMFSLSGFFNVVLFTWTRPALMPANKRRPSINIQVSRTTYSTRGAGGAAAGAHASGPYPHHRGKPRVSGSIVMDFEEDERRMSDNYDMQTMGSPTTVHGVLAPKLYPEVTAHLDLERATRESPQLEKDDRSQAFSDQTLDGNDHHVSHPFARPRQPPHLELLDDVRYAV
jgi:hypothetical protein